MALELLEIFVSPSTRGRHQSGGQTHGLHARRQNAAADRQNMPGRGDGLVEPSVTTVTRSKTNFRRNAAKESSDLSL